MRQGGEQGQGQKVLATPPGYFAGDLRAQFAFSQEKTFCYVSVPAHVRTRRNAGFLFAKTGNELVNRKNTRAGHYSFKGGQNATAAADETPISPDQPGHGKERPGKSLHFCKNGHGKTARQRRKKIPASIRLHRGPGAKNRPFPCQKDEPGKNRLPYLPVEAFLEAGLYDYMD